MIVFGNYSEWTTRLRQSMFIAFTCRRMEPTFMTLSHVLSLTLALFFTLPVPSRRTTANQGRSENRRYLYYLARADTPSPTYEAYKQGLRDLGYSEGKNISHRTSLRGRPIGSDGTFCTRVRATESGCHTWS